MERKDVVDEISISIHFVPFRKIKDVPKQIKRSNILFYFERSEIIQNLNLGYFDLINDIPKLFKRNRDLCVCSTHSFLFQVIFIQGILTPVQWLIRLIVFLSIRLEVQFLNSSR